jgi:N-acetylmuramoyl-L-alanine amidase
MPLALTLAAMISTASPVLADAQPQSRLMLDMATLGVAGVDSVSRSDEPAPQPGFRVPVTHSAKPPRSRYSITIPLDPPQPGLPRPRIFGRSDRPLVVIDAGHGGHDPGALAPTGGMREKDITLAIAKSIRDELLRGGRVRVALTRDDDRFLILQERAEIARGLKADLFISVHADAAPAPEASGATVYTLSEVASDRKAAQLAARENKADIINGVNLSGEKSDISTILIDLAQRETMNASARFATLLRREGPSMGFRSDYHKMAGFAVLKAPDTPAILLEVGYITNPVDVTRITSADGKAAIATGIRRAVDVHFARRFASR